MKSFWIKERHNPQLGVYYVACGQMTVKDARKYENGSLYGYNVMHRCANERAYQKRLAELKEAGESVQ